MKTIKIQFIFSLIFLFGCKSSSDAPETAFYYWKTIFKLNGNEKKILQENNVKTLYIRYFDVDLDSKNFPFPRKPIKFSDKPAGYKIIPVVFIKNKVMLNSEIDLDNFTDKILNFINQINTKNSITCNEIQIDCDWTLKSKINYLKTILLLKDKFKNKLSVTIRLHQIKYFSETGIPAADYGVLMYYNMGTIAGDSLNSVYDRQIAEKYISYIKKYPLKLDIALPIFTRGVLIRNKKVINLISKSDTKDYENDTNFVVGNDNLISVKKSNFKFGYYFEKNDIIKIENISFENLKEMANDLKKHMPESPEQIIYFDIDSINFKNYEYEKKCFETITNNF